MHFGRLDTAGNLLSDVVASDEPGSLGASSWHSYLDWTGSEYLVAWTDGRDWVSEIYLGRLDGLGNRLGRNARVSTNPETAFLPTLAWNGQEVGVVWADRRHGQYEAYFARMRCCDPAVDDDGDGSVQCQDCDDK